MRRTTSARHALVSLLVPLLLLAGAACAGGDKASGPDDDGVFGTYTLVRAGGQQVPGASVLQDDLGFGGLIGTYAQSGSFRISENGTWAFSIHFEQRAIAPGEPVTTIEYDVDDSGTYTMQGETITLGTGKVISLVNGVLSYTVTYTGIPGTPTTTVNYEYEK